MGQYRQWLLAQEVDQRMRAEVETLETELLYLKDRVTILEQALPNTENVILQALLNYQHAQTGKGMKKTAASRNALNTMQTPRPTDVGATPYYFGLQHTENGLKPGDMLALLEERERARSDRSRTAAEHSKIDEIQQQNESIRRWFERWHRESLSIARTEEMPYER